MLVALLFGCLLPVLSGCSNVLGLPKSGAVQVMKPTEQDTRRIFTNPSGPVKDAQPEAILARGSSRPCRPACKATVFRKQLVGSLPVRLRIGGIPMRKRWCTQVLRSSRKASFADSSAVNDEITVSVRLQVQGMLDSHGVYLAVPEETETFDFTLSKVQGQWRIGKLPSGVMVGADDFKQAYRQVSLYQLGTSRKELIPDVRWQCWRDCACSCRGTA